MPRLAAQRCVLHPKATLLLQNIINEPSQQVPFKKKEEVEEEEVRECIYVQCENVHACICVCKCAEVVLMVRERGGGERIRAGSGVVRWFNLESLM